MLKALDETADVMQSGLASASFGNILLAYSIGFSFRFLLDWLREAEGLLGLIYTVLRYIIVTVF